jgi:glycosyltransferase involved in cell wall biosynthesis
MRVLLVHNFYQEPGGEDRVFSDEGAMLEAEGHTVVRHTAHNDAVRELGKLQLARATIWNGDSYRALRQLIHETRPDVAHFHNTLPLISPAAYYAARAEGVPVVQTLHNYRLICANAYLFRDGRVCEDCLGRSVPWPAVRHACYRGDRAATAAVAAMLTAHRAFGTWRDCVDAYIALTEFARAKFVAGGLPAERIIVKPNAVYPDRGVGRGAGNYAAYVGRLSREKGVLTLLAAWEQLGDLLPLVIVGDGPLAPEVAAAAARNPGIRWLGQRSPDEVHTVLADAMCLVLPSECYETFGRVAVEAFAAGTPVVTTRTGASCELVDEGRTGLLMDSADGVGLAAVLRRALGSRRTFEDMRGAARSAYEARFTPQANVRLLLGIYSRVVSGARGVAPVTRGTAAVVPAGS